MAKCMACGKFTGAKDVAVCSICANNYHLGCVQLKLMPKDEWRCQCCRKKTSGKKTGKEISRDTPNSSSSRGSFESTMDHGDKHDLEYEMREFRRELQQMKEELKKEIQEFRQEVADLRKAVTTCSTRVDGLESRITALENRQEGVASEDLQSKFDQTVAHLKLELNDREQELLHSDLEISNLPEGSGENVIHTVELVARKLGVSLETRDIIFAERVGPIAAVDESGGGIGSAASAPVRPRRVVVRLARRALRDQLLQSARTRRGATSADLGLPAPPRRFYLNERLTRHNKQLFYRVRQAAERLGWRYTWTKRGRIYAKQSDGKRTYYIRTDSDFERVFPSENNNKINN